LKNRREDAAVALKRLRKDHKSEEEIQSELDELAEVLSIQREDSSFKDIFTRLNRKRTWVVISMNFFQQATGQAFASQFGTLFVKSLKTLQPFSITMGTNAIDVGALLICLATVDMFGRRYVYLQKKRW
jgi:SP family sugar:H+ symporter-like MFS transporter